MKEWSKKKWRNYMVRDQIKCRRISVFLFETSRVGYLMPNVSWYSTDQTWLELCPSHKIPTIVRRSHKSYSVMWSHNLILVFIVRFIINNVWVNFTERFIACFNLESFIVFCSSTYIIHKHTHAHTHTHTLTYTALLQYYPYVYFTTKRHLFFHLSLC